MESAGSHSVACHCVGQGKIPGQSLWEFLLEKVALGQGFLWILHLSPVNIIPPSSQYH